VFQELLVLYLFLNIRKREKYEKFCIHANFY